MAQYKVPQNVEAEDKILGPLTLKQFIYAMIGVAYGFLTFQLFKSFLPLFIVVGVPPTLLFLMLGLYQKQDQPFETYLLSIVEFMIKPRQRIWRKDDLLEAFEVKMPEPEPVQIASNPVEVRGQLERLAQIVDTRGWAAKRPELQEPVAAHMAIDLGSRLVEPLDMSVPEEPEDDIRLEDDILDFQNNPSAQNLDVLIQDAVHNIRDEAMHKMREYKKEPSEKTTTTVMTQQPHSDILKLATEEAGLTISQIASQAKRHMPLSAGKEVDLRNADPGK